MSLEALISTYGYPAVGIGTFFEGETILVLGGFAAHSGYLQLPWVIVWAFIGSLCGDQLFFYIGRFQGDAVLEKRPHWKPKAEKVFALLDRHQNWLIVAFRFIYGLRTVTPFLIGASGISPLRFLILNVIGASVWAIVFGSLGYLFGQAMDVVLGNIKRYELLVFGILITVAVLVWAVRLHKK
jgi:membrane protein DedA with SNARE-associated domain